MFDQLNTLNDIDSLIKSGVRESETLEYKTASVALSPNDHKEVAKDVSAFANSSGGLIIYGVATDKGDRTKPTHREDILASNIDTILQVIATHIRQPIGGLRFKTLPIGAPAQLLLVSIPQSELAPHQVSAQDYRYYRRQADKSVPMAHDLIELYFARRSAPALEPLVQTSDRSDPPPQMGGWLIEFRVSLVNRGSRLGRLAMIRMEVPKLGPVKQVRMQSFETVVHRDNTTAYDGYRFPMPATELYYPGVPLYAMTFDVIVPEMTLGKNRPLLFLEIYADEMRPRRYQLWLTAENERLAVEAAIELT